MNTDLNTLTFANALEGLEKKAFSSVELTQAALARIEAADSKINAFIHLNPDALSLAQASDQRRAASQSNALDGLPIGLKDLFCSEGLTTTCGSKILNNFVPPYSATVSERLAQAGTVLVGKNNMDEFAMGSTNESSHWGATLNPHDLTRVPGGSSGGSAAAVASGMCLAAIGSDTGGSVRQPAAYCGLTGFKPSYGRISRWGMVAYASSFDQAGTLTRTAEDAALLLNAIAGPCSKDSTCNPNTPADFTKDLTLPLQGKVIGLPKGFIQEGLASSISDNLSNTLRIFESLGAEIKEVELDHTELAIAAYYIIAPAEASSNLSRFDGVRFGHRCDNPRDLEDLYKRSRTEGFGAEVKRRILIGTYVLSAGYYDAYFNQALKVRQLIKQAYESALAECDVLISPVAPDVAPKLGEQMDDPVKMYLSDAYTVGVNMAGLPAVSFPTGFDGKLPIGLQLIGRSQDETTLLNMVHQFQQETHWHAQHPNLEAIL